MTARGAVIVLLLFSMTAFAQRPSDNRLAVQKLQNLLGYNSDELRWSLEFYLQPHYLNGHHKRALKALQKGEWATAVSEYEACLREFGLSQRTTRDDANTSDVRQAQQLVLRAPFLNTIRYELALSYASRAHEMMNMGWSSEADSLLELADFFLENVQVFASNATNAGMAFIRLGDLSQMLGEPERAIGHYHGALWVMEDSLPKSDPLRATAGLRLGAALLSAGDFEHAEPPLLHGTECADSAGTEHEELRRWCAGMSVEGRLLLAEDCRGLGRIADADSLYAEAIHLALGPDEPVVSPGSLSALENYARMLRERGEQEEADSVNYRTDVLRHRWEHEQQASNREKK